MKLFQPVSGLDQRMLHGDQYAPAPDIAKQYRLSRYLAKTAFGFLHISRK